MCCCNSCISPTTQSLECSVAWLVLPSSLNLPVHKLFQVCLQLAAIQQPSYNYFITSPQSHHVPSDIGRPRDFFKVTSPKKCNDRSANLTSIPSIKHHTILYAQLPEKTLALANVGRLGSECSVRLKRLSMAPTISEGVRPCGNSFGDKCPVTLQTLRETWNLHKVLMMPRAP